MGKSERSKEMVWELPGRIERGISVERGDIQDKWGGPQKFLQVLQHSTKTGLAIGTSQVGLLKQLALHKTTAFLGRDWQEETKAEDMS